MRSRKAKVPRSQEGPTDVTQERDLKKLAKQIQAKLTGDRTKSAVKRKVKRTLQVQEPQSPPPTLEKEVAVIVKDQESESATLEPVNLEKEEENVSGSCEAALSEVPEETSHSKRTRESYEKESTMSDQPEPVSKKLRISTEASALPAVIPQEEKKAEEDKRVQEEEKAQEEERERQRLLAEERLRIAAQQRERAQEIRRLQREQRDKEREEKRKEDEARKLQEVCHLLSSILMKT